MMGSSLTALLKKFVETMGAYVGTPGSAVSQPLFDIFVRKTARLAW
jgi:hypothetical protein